jgi:hypothetical protein
MIAAALSLMVLATIALLGGAVYLLRRGGERRRPILMLVLAAVLAVNVAIWTMPGPEGPAPLSAAPR